jgi:hypothetical protein
MSRRRKWEDEFCGDKGRWSCLADVLPTYNISPYEPGYIAPCVCDFTEGKSVETCLILSPAYEYGNKLKIESSNFLLLM